MQKYLIVLFAVLFFSGCKGSSFTSECKQAHEKFFKCLEENVDMDNMESAVETCGTNYIADVFASFRKLPDNEQKKEKINNFKKSSPLSKASKVVEDKGESECGSKETEREQALCGLRIGLNIMAKEMCKVPAK